MRRYAAVVVGLGQIGQGYDYDCDDGRRIVTPASSYRYHSGFELAAGIDPDPEQRERFERKYAKPAFPSLAGLPAELEIDVYSICVPTGRHAEAFFAALDRGAAAIVCEKPIAGTVEDAGRMVSEAEAHGCAVVVNYMRRFEPGVLSLREIISTGRIGDVYKGVVWYGKGLIHNGSHFVDLLRFLLGEASRPELLSREQARDGRDPEPDLRMHFGSADLYFLAARADCFTLAEFELIGTKGRVAYRGGGEKIEAWETEADVAFPGYTVLGRESMCIENDFGRYQWHVADNLYRHLTEGAPLHSTGETATETLRAVESIVSLL
jgi:predicted dehydrogenase